MNEQQQNISNKIQLQRTFDSQTIKNLEDEFDAVGAIPDHDSFQKQTDSELVQEAGKKKQRHSHQRSLNLEDVYYNTPTSLSKKSKSSLSESVIQAGKSKIMTQPKQDRNQFSDDGLSYSFNSSEQNLTVEQRDRLTKIVQHIFVQSLAEEQEKLNEYVVEDEIEVDKTPNLVEGIFIVKKKTFFEVICCKKPKSNPKICVYDARSLYIFDHESQLRNIIVTITESKIFEYLIIVVILLSTIIMLCEDQSDPDAQSEFNRKLELIGQVSVYIFAVECLLRIISMGLVVHENAYLRDAWNWIDFVGVITGIIELCQIQGGSLRALRALRVLRPLRSIKQFPSMRKLIQGMINSMPALLNAIIFMLFVYTNFAILASWQYGGAYYFRCRTTVDVVDGKWPYDRLNQQLCNPNSGDTGHQCPVNQTCGYPSMVGLSNDTDTLSSMQYIDYGFTNFNNLFQSMITIFICITMDGWSNIMYNLMDQQQQTYIVPIFFAALVIIGGLFLLNVLLAIFSDALDHSDTIQIMKNNEKKLKLALSVKRADSQRKGRELSKIKFNSTSMSDFDLQSVTKQNEQLPTKKLRTLKENEEEHPQQYQFKSKTSIFLNSKNSRSTLDDNTILRLKSANHPNHTQSQLISVFDGSKDEDHSEIQNTQVVVLEQKNNQTDNIQELERCFESSSDGDKKALEDIHKDNQLRNTDRTVQIRTLIAVKTVSIPLRARQNRCYFICFNITERPGFQIIIVLMILLNTIVLAMDRYPISDEESNAHDIINIVLTFLFIIEMLIKIGAHGIKQYSLDRFNLFDTLVVMLSIVDMVIWFAQVDFNRNVLTTFRVFRLLRIIKLGRNLKSFSLIIHLITSSFKDIWTFTILMIVFFIVFMILGMQLFSFTVFIDHNDKIVTALDGGKSPTNNFDNPYNAFITVFAVMIGDNWSQMMFSFMRYEFYLSAAYFCTLTLVLQIVLLNLFTALLLSNFEDQITGTNEFSKRSGMEEMKYKLFKNINKNALLIQSVMNGICCLKLNIVQEWQESDGDESDLRRFQTRIVEEEMIYRQKLNVNNLRLVAQFEQQNRRILKIEGIKDKKINKNQSENKISIAQTVKNDLIDISHTDKKVFLKGISLFVFGPHNCFRIACSQFINWKHYDFLSTLAILVSTINLSIYSPLLDPQSTISLIVTDIDIFTTSLFTIEAFIKIVAFGLVINGKQSYLRVFWNVIDLMTVIISILSFLLPNDQNDYFFIKVLRMVRFMRSIRVIQKNPGLRIAVQSLINSLPGIFNLFVFAIMMITLFAILGVNVFKGSFSTCEKTNIPFQLQSNILTYWDCIDYGGEWVNADANFDNVINALISQFIIMTRENWEPMFKMASQFTSNYYDIPKANSNPLTILYFVVCLIFSSLFILNLLVGVMISTFNIEKEKLSHNAHLTKLETEYVDICLLCYKAQPLVFQQTTGCNIKDRMLKLATSRFLDYFIFACIILNSILFMISFQGQPDLMTEVIEWINKALTIVFIAEFVVKVIAFGHRYFYSAWNWLDFFIVVTSLIDFLLDYLLIGQNFNSAFKIIRVFRLARLLKLVNRFKVLQRILMTFINALPALGNVGALLFLFLYLYAVIGVNLFSTVKLQENLNKYANFQTIGTALLTLFRIQTGENWNWIMDDAGRQHSIKFQCQDQSTFNQIQKDGVQGCGQKNLSYLYFISFQILVSFILQNLFIAIILEAFQKQLDEEAQSIQPETIEEFKQIWKEFDHKGTGMISVDSLEILVARIVEKELLILKKTPHVHDVLFNFHQSRLLKLFTSWLTKKDDGSTAYADLVKSERLQMLLQRHMNKFLGDLYIPTYNKVQHYNFHDVLVSFVRYYFTQRHKQNYKAREIRIQNLKDTGQELDNFDRIQVGSDEFKRLNFQDRQTLYELNCEHFADVVRSIETKGTRTEKKILRITDMLALRRKLHKKNAKLLDDFGTVVIDSSLVIGAKIIQKFLVQRKLKHANRLQRRGGVILNPIPIKKIEAMQNKVTYDKNKLNRQRLLTEKAMVYVDWEDQLMKKTADLFLVQNSNNNISSDFSGSNPDSSSFHSQNPPDKVLSSENQLKALNHQTHKKLPSFFDESAINQTKDLYQTQQIQSKTKQTLESAQSLVMTPQGAIENELKPQNQIPTDLSSMMLINQTNPIETIKHQNDVSLRLKKYDIMQNTLDVNESEELLIEVEFNKIFNELIFESSESDQVKKSQKVEQKVKRDVMTMRINDLNRESKIAGNLNIKRNLAHIRSVTMKKNHGEVAVKDQLHIRQSRMQNFIEKSQVDRNVAIDVRTSRSTSPQLKRMQPKITTVVDFRDELVLFDEVQDQATVFQNFD